MISLSYVRLGRGCLIFALFCRGHVTVMAVTWPERLDKGERDPPSDRCHQHPQARRHVSSLSHVIAASSSRYCHVICPLSPRGHVRAGEGMPGTGVGYAATSRLCDVRSEAAVEKYIEDNKVPPLSRYPLVHSTQPKYRSPT
eukprot:3940497-Rhodomonas_salina.2